MACKCHNATFCPDLVFVGYDNDVPVFEPRVSAADKPAVDATREMLARLILSAGAPSIKWNAAYKIADAILPLVEASHGE